MEKKKYDIRVILMFLLLYKLINMSGQMKYGMALIIISIVFFLMILKEKVRDKDIPDNNIKDLLIFIAPSSFYIIYSCIIIYLKSNYRQMDYFIKESLFISSSILLAWSIVRWINKKFNIKQLFFCITIIFFIDKIRSFSLENLMESTLSFAFGAFLLYFLMKKEWKYVFLSLVLVYLSNKRVVLLAIAVSVLVLIIIKIIRDIQVKHAIWVALIIFAYVYIYSISSSWLNSIIYENQINTMGRIDIYKYVKDLYEFKLTFYGNGIGSVMTELATYNIKSARNLHNDFLKLYIEIGFIGLLVYCLIYNFIFKYVNKHYKESIELIYILLIYTFLLYTTDNTIIYMCYLTPLYTIIFYDIRSYNKG